MGQMVKLTSSDGFELGAYRADPAGAPKGGVVIIQEIFGVNKHIKEVCDGYAADGYIAIAPALFDRVEKDLELGYVPEDQEKGKATRGQLNWDDSLADSQAAAEAIRGDAGKVGIIGYCFGGSVAWIAATRGNFDCAVSYYGGNAAEFAEEVPKCPVICHIGTEDKGVNAEKVATIKAARPEVPVHMYEGAGHGFNCDHRGSFDEAASKTARERSLALLAENIG
ncbi:MAG: dienelactone hydrolase family protein [Rhodospirillales bacterium]|jgi:carboxymethylenebutenolidase|nr:dienelactone hydrolase family protein [Rhodospirillales bacterium]MBT4006880.1 dienelactone hydrolase family protein [Rhodospirillales bacterium]MBT5075455.1 dienelactone hydrolase family protein [Rhodospirillales bacterium]MBT5113093.1 dienelactone hydrolase family protein [Rhodospirillales bacterium]MBT5672969.1 dienelactone hydrolase family protein [Rhodospirillales bacterium]